MKKCKICGQYFEYHITNSHLETHGISREDYNNIPIRDQVFVMGHSEFDKTNDDVISHVIRVINRNKRRRNSY